jgi:putative hydrolase of the HAD superfamily
VKAPQALSFDLDGTLYDGNGLQASIERTCEIVAASQPDLPAVRLLEANGEVWRAYWPGVERQWSLGALDGASLRLEAWRRTLRACGCDDDSTARFASRTHGQLGREAHRLFNDAQELLNSLRQRQTPLALICNGASDTQREKLRVLDIENRFTVVVISGEVGAAKPDPIVFTLASKRIGVHPKNLWHIGDSLTTDVAGATAVGFGAVWLNRNGLTRKEGDPIPNAEIRSLSQLIPFLA